MALLYCITNSDIDSNLYKQSYKVVSSILMKQEGGYVQNFCLSILFKIFNKK